MEQFRYRALARNGKTIVGVLEAPSQSQALQQIRALGYLPISARRQAERRWPARLGRRLLPVGRLPQRQLAIATHELAMLLQSGMALDRALAIVAGLGETARLKTPFMDVMGRVRDGASLAEALAADSLFPKLYVSMVQAGELGGSLGSALHRLAEYYERAQAIRETIASALVYPTILVITAGVSLSAILVFVLPEFEPLFESTGKPVPAQARLLIDAGNILGHYWWLLLLLVATGIGAAKRLLAHPEVRRRWDRFRLRLPILGPLQTRIELERLSRSLGILLTNGVALPTALGITRAMIGNVVIAEAVAKTAISLREGESLTERLARTGVFPAMAIDFFRIGEETGKLDDMLSRLADICERAIKRSIDRLLAMLVPALTLFLGAMVAGLIVSMLMAILSINDLAVR